MLEFAFRKFAFRWRKIKLHSGLHLWQANVVQKKAHQLYQKRLTYRAIQIQRAYRRKLRRDVDATTELSIAHKIRDMLLEQALTRERHQLQHAMAIRIQSHWRGLSCRLTWSCLLQLRLQRALAALAVHQLFGGSKEVQMAAGHFYATSETDIQLIHQGHYWLRQRAPPFYAIERLRCATEIELVGDRRESQWMQCRTKQRHTFWSMMETQLMEMSLAETRAVRIRERRMERLRAKQDVQQRQTDELRGVRNLLQWQEARVYRERSENYAMSGEEALVRRHLRDLAALEAKLQSDHMKKSVSLLKHAMRLQLAEQERASLETKFMMEADAAQRLAMDIAKVKTTSMCFGHCVIEMACRLDPSHASPMAALELLLCMRSKGSPTTTLVHRVHNKYDMRRGLWAKLAEACELKMIKEKRTRAVHREARRMENGVVEFVAVRVGDDKIYVGISRCGGDGKMMEANTISTTCPLVAMVAHMQNHQMVWLRPKNLHLLAKWVASKAKWEPPGRLVLLPPIEVTISGRSLQPSLSPAIGALLQRGLHDMLRFVPKLFPS
ncbi:hypothetical protein, variant [Aphanomyces invadans]|uniref:Uncharacterized protein n=1 Tax=Aphanomyces invadans TaxID=157072 RepID=A0A024UWC4_9STRA|nr:hypothetical protein H310_00352 [Aphanomyces invadans]XP_008861335.1 hypothetical protein, variant [Aphanomyces invadans]ETW09923.1 hypothetical protein H310_00352 [Aphanomyces invadans]ETW09924.1 hypothetical protein, variant [Aphanomyces invadans]|eukprot:XP_008861334.1 hypothetical protein H310_00352 [Aphanomyces invadans]